MFPATPRWVLDTGLGGMVGDFAASRVAKLSHEIPSALLWPAFALLFLPAGAWFSFRACGLSAKALSLAFDRESASAERAAAFEMPTEEVAEQKLVNKATSWVKRFALKERALTVISQPREYWMAVARTEPSLTPAKMEKPRAKGLATRGQAAASTPSPFANWGSRRSSRSGFVSGCAGEDAASFEAQPAREEEPRREAESEQEIFEDIRIEPFFGPRLRRMAQQARRAGRHGARNVLAAAPSHRHGDGKRRGMARSAYWKTAQRPQRPLPLRAASPSFT